MKKTTSYHFYDAQKTNLEEIFQILYEFEKEAPALEYPNIDRTKMKDTLMKFIDRGKIILIKNLDEDKIIGIAIFIFTEYQWSREQLLSIQTIYILPEYRSFKLFNQIMDIIKKQAKNRTINFPISSRLMADKLMERYGFEKMGTIWRLNV
tara:strand:+ start:471 stop:923 length:453 start_codon:yes stop_codon:yes gene_type:complete